MPELAVATDIYDDDEIAGLCCTPEHAVDAHNHIAAGNDAQPFGFA